MLDNLYVVTGKDIEKRNTEVRALIQEHYVQGARVVTFAQADLDLGREGAIKFYNTLEAELTNMAIPSRRGKHVIIVINCAEDYVALISHHYRMMSYALAVAIGHSNVGLKIILAVEDDFNLSPDDYVRRLFTQ